MLFCEWCIGKVYEVLVLLLFELDFLWVCWLCIECGELFFCMCEVVGELNSEIWIDVIECGEVLWCYWLELLMGCKY